MTFNDDVGEPPFALAGLKPIVLLTAVVAQRGHDALVVQVAMRDEKILPCAAMAHSRRSGLSPQTTGG